MMQRKLKDVIWLNTITAWNLTLSQRVCLARHHAGNQCLIRSCYLDAAFSFFSATVILLPSRFPPSLLAGLLYEDKAVHGGESNEIINFSGKAKLLFAPKRLTLQETSEMSDLISGNKIRGLLPY